MRTAFITGASSGIGASFARQLAVRGYNLILVGRRQDRLATIAVDLEQQHAISAEYVVADLSDSSDLEQLEHRIRELSGLEMLVNNAGFGTTGRFAEIDLAKQLDMVQVHIATTMRLCRAALPGMISRHQGAIINVASIGAFLSAVDNVTYNATKAFLVSFSESLQKELSGTDIQVQALCPGFTHTEFHDRPEYIDLDRSQIPDWLWSSSDEVVKESLRAIQRRQVICIPGFKNRLLIALFRNCLTSYLLQKQADAVIRKAAEPHPAT